MRSEEWDGEGVYVLSSLQVSIEANPETSVSLIILVRNMDGREGMVRVLGSMMTHHRHRNRGGHGGHGPPTFRVPVAVRTCITRKCYIIG